MKGSFEITFYRTKNGTMLSVSYKVIDCLPLSDLINVEFLVSLRVCMLSCVCKKKRDKNNDY